MVYVCGGGDLGEGVFLFILGPLYMDNASTKPGSMTRSVLYWISWTLSVGH